MQWRKEAFDNSAGAGVNVYVLDTGMSIFSNFLLILNQICLGEDIPTLSIEPLKLLLHMVSPLS